MLPRVGAALYGVGRDVERAYWAARLAEFSDATALDGPAANGAGRRDVWEPMVAVAADRARFLDLHRRAEARSVGWFLTLSDANPDAALSCLGRAHERARTIRADLPVEVFEAIATCARSVAKWGPARVAREGVFAFCQEVRIGVAGIDGVLDRSFRRDERWQVVRLGRHLERAVRVTRLAAEHVGVADDGRGLGDWRVLLSAASAYEEYLHAGLGRGSTPIAFLMQDPFTPSSVAFCLSEGSAALEALRLVSLDSGRPTPRAAVASAARAAAAVSGGDQASALKRLSSRLGDVDACLQTTLFPSSEVADDASYAQAVRQAQN